MTVEFSIIFRRSSVKKTNNRPEVGPVSFWRNVASRVVRLYLGLSKSSCTAIGSFLEQLTLDLFFS